MGTQLADQLQPPFLHCSSSSSPPRSSSSRHATLAWAPGTAGSTISPKSAGLSTYHTGR